MKLKINFIVIATSLFVISCDNLDRFPLDTPSDANFFSNEGELALGVNGIYNMLWFHTGATQVIQNLDNTTDIGFLRGDYLRDFADGSVTSLSSGVESFWTHLYQGIARANNVLTNMHRSRDVVPEAFYLRIEAESRFLRAYFYHLLTEMYGDVPLLTEIPPLAEAEIGRHPKSEVAEQMISDLEFAGANLPAAWTGNNAGRATRGAAQALLARIALYNGKYELAANAAKQVIDGNVYQLYPSYENLFQYAGIRCPEVIFDVPYLQGSQVHQYPQLAGSRLLGSFSSIVPTQFMVDAYTARDGLPIDKSLLYDMAKPFENRDPRLKASIVVPQSELGGYLFETHPDSLQTWRIENGVKTGRVANLDVTNPFATFTGYLWRKYNSPLDYPQRRTASELNFILVRYAEVLLTYAEAKIEMNAIDQSVLDAMNRVRARAYGTTLSNRQAYPEITVTTQGELRRILRNERKVELANEGFRLFDIRRWKIADQVMAGPLVGRPFGAYQGIARPPVINEETGHPDYGAQVNLYRQVIPRSFRAPRNWLYPIPQAELNANKNVVQNTGY